LAAAARQLQNSMLHLGLLKSVTLLLMGLLWLTEDAVCLQQSLTATESVSKN
jgi:hypothetical protein